MEKLVSVIVPVYRVEKYLHRCVDSLLRQSHQHLEILLVDDGSPDECPRICDEYAQTDSRIKVIHKNNEGLSKARNSGIATATGELITFVDSDDWLHEQFIQTLCSHMEQEQADIAASNFVRTSTFFKHLPDDNYSTYVYSSEEALAQYLDRFYVPLVVAWGKIYKKSLFDGIRYPTGKLHEDEFTTHKLIHRAQKIVFTTMPLYFYFQREDSIIGGGFDIHKRLATIEAYDERARFFRDVSLDSLSDQTYRLLFLKMFNIDQHLNEIDDVELMRRVKQHRRHLKPLLRQGNYALKFRLFYETYYLMPRTLLFFYHLIKSQSQNNELRS